MLEDLNGCPITLVDVGSLRDPDDVAGGEQPSRAPRQQLTEIDTRIGEVIEGGPEGRRLRRRLALGCRPQRAAAARRRPRTALRPRPARLAVDQAAGAGPGARRHRDGAGGRRPARAGCRAGATAARATRRRTTRSAGPRPGSTYLADYDEASHDVHDLVEPFFTVFAYGQLAIYLLVLLVYKGRLGSEAHAG